MDDDLTAAQHKFAEALLQMQELYTTIFAAASGLRSNLVADGWSTEWAEQIAAETMITTLHSLRQSMTIAKKDET